jgi:class 3 adenylate cyclase
MIKRQKISPLAEFGMHFTKLIRHLDSVGIKPEHSFQAKRRIRFTTRLLASSAMFAVIYTVLTLALRFESWITYLNVSMIAVFVGLIALNITGPRMLVKGLGLLFLNAYIFFFLFLSGPAFGSILSIAVPIAVPFFLFARNERWWIVLPILLTCCLTLLCFYAYAHHLSPYIQAMTGMTSQLFGTVLGLISVILVIVIFYQLYSRDEEELVFERQKSEKLLLNILPHEIAERLKKGEEPIADRFEKVSVLFADICQFTSLSGKLQPEEVVEMLNEIFTSFDELATRHGLEKIKTIGDAYMAVGGLSATAQHQVPQTLMFAKEMLEVLNHHEKLKDKGLAIRIGIHVGPVVAGVIGKNKFIYDLWGDTVNIASRMESHGVEGRIHVSEQVKNLAGDAFVFSTRGLVEIKGKGEMTSYLLDA